MSYLVDTSACVQLLKGRWNPTASRLRRELRVKRVFVPSIVLFELWFGVFKSQLVSQNSSRAERLLSMGVEFLDFNHSDAEAAGRIRVALQARNQMIGPYDTLIAGQALARGLTLVTSNQGEFSRVDGLLWEDWAVESA